MRSCCVVQQKYLIIKQLKIAPDVKGICYPPWVVAPHCFPYLDAAHVAEPIRSVRSCLPVLGGSGSGPSAAVALQGSLATKDCACSKPELDGGGVIFTENSDLLYKSKVQTEQF